MKNKLRQVNSEFTVLFNKNSHPLGQSRSFGSRFQMSYYDFEQFTKFSLKFSMTIKWARAHQDQQNDLCTQRRLRSAWSESSLSTWRNLESWASHWAQSRLLISLLICLGWSDLGTLVILLVLSCGSSKFGLISVLQSFNIFGVISGAVSFLTTLFLSKPPRQFSST